MLPFLLLLAGFGALIKGADWLVTGASAIARRFKMSELVIGLTIVALGTSSPELFVNIISSTRGNTDLAIGNILGSNIANIFLILGVTAIIYPISVSKGTIWKEIPFSLLGVLVLAVLANDHLIDGAQRSILTRSNGLILLGFFAIFMYYLFDIAAESMPSNAPPSKQSAGLAKSIFLIVLGFAGLLLGGKWIVDSAVSIALRFGMSESTVGLTIVAIGTSLPELATSVVAAAKKNVEIAVGNVVGSNILNIFFVLGITSTITPIPFNEKSNIDIAVVVFASILFFMTMFTGRRRKLERWEGLIFLLFYASYLTYLLVSR